jgi:hypothetical protein
MSLRSGTYLVMFCAYMCTGTARTKGDTKHHNQRHDYRILFHTIKFDVYSNKNYAVVHFPRCGVRPSLRQIRKTHKTSLVQIASEENSTHRRLWRSPSMENFHSEAQRADKHGLM